MDRSAALRISALFVLISAFLAATGFAAEVPLAEVLFLVSASFCGLMLIMSLVATPARAPVPVRIRRRH